MTRWRGPLFSWMVTSQVGGEGFVVIEGAAAGAGAAAKGFPNILFIAKSLICEGDRKR